MHRVLICWFVLTVVGVVPAAASEKVPLHVRYVVGANAERTADFKKFLEGEFATVSVVAGKDFDPKSGQYDVLIVDTRVQPVLPPDFTRPILLLGSNASGIDELYENGLWTAHMVGSKLDWL
jgi:hypothetical protein